MKVKHYVGNICNNIKQVIKPDEDFLTMVNIKLYVKHRDDTTCTHTVPTCTPFKAELKNTELTILANAQQTFQKLFWVLHWH